MSSTTATATGHVPSDEEPSLDPLDAGERGICETLQSPGPAR